MNRNVVGLDIAKQVFHLFIMQEGKALKKTLKRSELLGFIVQLPSSLIAMEACGGSNHCTRKARPVLLTTVPYIVSLETVSMIVKKARG